jgi:hypothetical protein
MGYMLARTKGRLLLKLSLKNVSQQFIVKSVLVGTVTGLPLFLGEAKYIFMLRNIA